MVQAVQSLRSVQNVWERLERLERLLAAYLWDPRSLRRVQRILRLLAIQTESLNDGNIVYREKNRFFAIRPVDVLVPSPVGQREGVMLRPLQRFVADDARALAADDEVCRARCVTMLFRMLAG